MSTLVNNEVSRLFSLAFGAQWIRAGLLARTNEELKDIDSLASDNVDNVLHQIAAIGKILGSEKLDEMEVTRLGWAAAHLAEYANVASVMATFARELQDPEARALSKTIMGVEE